MSEKSFWIFNWIVHLWQLGKSFSTVQMMTWRPCSKWNWNLLCWSIFSIWLGNESEFNEDSSLWSFRMDPPSFGPIRWFVNSSGLRGKLEVREPPDVHSVLTVVVVELGYEAEMRLLRRSRDGENSTQDSIHFWNTKSLDKRRISSRRPTSICVL